MIGSAQRAADGRDNQSPVVAAPGATVAGRGQAEAPEAEGGEEDIHLRGFALLGQAPPPGAAT